MNNNPSLPNSQTPGEENGGNGQLTECKTFSQRQVDTIITERLAKQQRQFDAILAEKTAELAQREKLITIKADWTARGLPVALLDSIDLNKEGALEAAEAALKSAYNTNPEANKPRFAEPPQAGKPLPKFGGPIRNTGSTDDASGLRAAFGFDHRKE